MSNFILGLKLETTVTYSGDCIDNLVYTVDDVFYLMNNISDFTWKSFEAPFLNASRAVGGNFSFISVNCYQAGVNLWNGAETKF
jgi:hypothetical protein